MNVLLGIGGSEHGWDALTETLERAEQAGDDLTIAIYEDDAAELSADEIETRVREELTESGVEAELRRIEGHPGGGLVEVAEGENFDRLVIAGGSRSTLGKIQLGSVAEFVVLNSETPVTLIR